MNVRDIVERLRRLEQKVESMVRVGVVSAVDRQKCRVRVAFEGSFVSHSLPVLVKQSLNTKDFWMPEVDEQVTCVFLPNGTEVGFVLGSFYSDEEEIPSGAEAVGMRVVKFSDGARFEYDVQNSKLKIVVGSLEMEITPSHFRFGGSSATQSFVRGEDFVTIIKAVMDLVGVNQTHPTGVGPSGPPANAAAVTAKKAELDATLSTIFKSR